MLQLLSVALLVFFPFSSTSTSNRPYASFPRQLQAFQCSEKCYENNGNCNQELKTCECNVGRSGPGCEIDSLPSCRTSSSPDSIAYIGFELVKNCDCWAQLSGVSNMKDPAPHEDARRPYLFRESFEHDRNTQIKCFRSVAGPQTSDIPFPLNSSQIEWFEGLGKHARRIDPPTEIKIDDWSIQHPLSMCLDRCSDRGACIQRGQSKPQCTCVAGSSGPSCSHSDPNGCINRCGGNGVCRMGFCHCTQGFWGSDCSRNLAYAPPNDTSSLTAGQERSTLRIYRYELPWQVATYKSDTRELQFGYDQIYAAWERFYEHFSSDTVTRTQDIWEANLFYIPAFLYLRTSNLGNPGHFVRHIVHYLRNSYREVWDRKHGKDHFIFLTQDRGPCNLPNRAFINNLIKVVHFGMQAKEPWSHHAIHDLALPPESEVSARRRLQIEPGSKQKSISNIDKSSYSCFLPARDVVTPDYWIDHNQDIKKAPAVYAQALAGAPRQYLLFFGGGIRPSDREYSGGVRLALSRYVLEKNYPDVRNGGDSRFYAQSTFCICPYGHGWGSRLTHAMLGGCIPVIIQDHVHAILDDVLEYPAFSLRLSKADVPNLMNILRGISAGQIQAYRREMSKVWRYFTWHEGGAAYNGTLTSLRRKFYNLQAYHYK